MKGHAMSGDRPLLVALAVCCAGRSSDALVHQGAADIVGTGGEAGSGTIRPHLDP